MTASSMLVGLSILGTSETRAEDHVVDIRCVTYGSGPRYRIHPDTVTVVAGVDRVVFRSPPYAEAQCAIGPNLEIGIWGPDVISIWFYGETSPPQGPFCEAGTRSYWVTERGSGGQFNGSFGPGVIEVVPSGAEDTLPGTTIGIFAESAAATCVLQSSPGSHRAFVCARLPGNEVDAFKSAEFRVGGFPAEWRLQWRPAPGVYVSGDLMGSGVQITTWNCLPRSQQVVVLFEIDYEASTPPSGAIVQVLAFRESGTRPHARLCDAHSIHEVCALGGYASFDASGAPCVVGVQSSTWTRVRSLYRTD